MFIDTHCHLDIIACFQEQPILNEEKLKQIEEIVNQAHQNNVEIILNVGCDVLTSKNSILLARKFKSVFAILGIHPTDISKDWKHDFKQVEMLVKQRTAEDKIVGIGEIGLDFYHKPFDKALQEAALEAQINLAIEQNLPISFHVREAGEDFLKFVEPYAKKIKAVVHCFQQSQEFADQVIKWGFFIGIDGPITYPKSNSLRDVVSKVDLSKIILETDSPFLPVQKERGKINYPSKIPLIAEEIAKVKNIDLKTVETTTTENVLKLFSLIETY